jgi:galactokinase
MKTFHAPGRVNIIGEHTDYNGGYVLPCAIDMGTTAKIRLRSDSVARFSSKNFDLAVEVSLDKISFDKKHDWANYPIGVLFHLHSVQSRITGFEIEFAGNIPNGAGLSSSASIELVTAFALNDVFELGHSTLELVKLSQKSENNFCGVNCGIMDQFAVGMGKKNHAIYLNCDTLEYKYVPLELSDCKIIIMNTNKRRRLNQSKYNERRAECERVAKLLSVKNLAELTPKDFELQKYLIRNEIILKRARHVVNENDRVKQAVAALETGDLVALGALITASHNSLRDDYEVSCPELDVIVENALINPDCLGARMMGAGFGGCAIAIVKNESIVRFIKDTSAAYENEIGYACAMYVCESGDGVREITLQNHGGLL